MANQTTEKPETNIDSLDHLLKIPLTELNITRHLKAGRNQSEIARIHKVSKQAVSDYIQRHYENILPMQYADPELAKMDKLVSIKAKNKIINILDSTLDKKDLIALNAISGTHTDKYRLLSNQPTEITANISLIADVNELLKQLKSGVNQPEIEDKVPDNCTLLPPDKTGNSK